MEALIFTEKTETEAKQRRHRMNSKRGKSVLGKPKEDRYVKCKGKGRQKVVIWIWGLGGV